MSDALTPRDYAKLLRPHDPSNAYPQPETDFWRKCKKGTERDPVWLTPPIIRHTGVQMLAALFGVRVREVVWQQREPGKCAVTCEVTVDGYAPVSDGVLLALRGVASTLSKEWPVPPLGTMQIGEVNSSNAGMTGKQYPQIFAYKRAFDRAVLDHLLVFDAYGDVEAPEFAQNADYEAAQRQHQSQPAGPAPGTFGVSNADWKKQPEEIRETVRTLMNTYKVPRQQLDQIYLDLAGEAEPLSAALAALLHRKQGAPQQDASNLFGGQGDGEGGQDDGDE